jgi:hypothetical protein
MADVKKETAPAVTPATPKPVAPIAPVVTPEVAPTPTPEVTPAPVPETVKTESSPETVAPKVAGPNDPVMIKLVKGQDYTVFGRTFKRDKAVEVTTKEANYLLKADGFFAVVSSESE